MKDLGTAARAAIAAGRAMSVGAVRIDTLPDPVLVWGGYGELEIEGEIYLGIGDSGLVSVTSSAIGGSEQNIVLELSGVDPDVLALYDMSSLRRAAVICYRLVFDARGQVLLATPVYARGRLDQAPKEETAGGTATVRAMVETAARGLGRGGGRMRSKADQTLIDPTDDGLKAVSFAGQTTIYFGGKVPQTAAQAFNIQAALNQAAEDLFR